MSNATGLAPAPASRLEYAALAAPNHPALRWSVAYDTATAHRRQGAQPAAWCGAPGTISVAAPGAELCRTCYAQRSVK